MGEAGGRLLLRQRLPDPRGRRQRLPWGTGLYVHTTQEKEGTFCYAVATAINGRANLRDISRVNAPADAIKESASPYPVPVLQLDKIAAKNEFGGVRDGARVRLYVTWNAEPFTNLPNMNEPGTFQCIEVKTGRVLCTERVGGGVWGSLVHADGRLYVTNLEGETLVLVPKPSLEILARNPLRERTLASIAVSDRAIFVRTYKHLWCIQLPDNND
jgi:hypothetical protein